MFDEMFNYMRFPMYLCLCKFFISFKTSNAGNNVFVPLQNERFQKLFFTKSLTTVSTLLIFCYLFNIQIA